VFTLLGLSLGKSKFVLVILHELESEFDYCRRMRRLAAAVIAPTLILHTALDILGEHLEEEEISKNEEDQEDAEDEEDEEDEEGIPETMPEDALFIPFGSAHELPKTYYKGSDPEWQSFIELANDKARSDHIRRKLLLTVKDVDGIDSGIDELALLVGHELVKFPAIPRVLGKPMIIRTAWLDIDFPDGPPPEYERSGYDTSIKDIRIIFDLIQDRNYQRLYRVDHQANICE
jgi:hypothetical protein